MFCLIQLGLQSLFGCRCSIFLFQEPHCSRRFISVSSSIKIFFLFTLLAFTTPSFLIDAFCFLILERICVRSKLYTSNFLMSAEIRINDHVRLPRFALKYFVLHNTRTSIFKCCCNKKAELSNFIVLLIREPVCLYCLVCKLYF